MEGATIMIEKSLIFLFECRVAEDESIDIVTA